MNDPQFVRSASDGKPRPAELVPRYTQDQRPCGPCGRIEDGRRVRLVREFTQREDGVTLVLPAGSHGTFVGWHDESNAFVLFDRLRPWKDETTHVHGGNLQSYVPFDALELQVIEVFWQSLAKSMAAQIRMDGEREQEKRADVERKTTTTAIGQEG